MPRLRHVLLLAMLSLTGCVIMKTPSRNSRYQVDITKMQKEDLLKDTWVYRHPTKKPSDYAKFIISPIEMYENTAAKISKKNKPYFAMKAEDLRQKAIELLGDSYPVVDTPGEGVLRIDISIYDIKPIVNYINKDGNEAVRFDNTLVGTKFDMDCYDSVSEEQIFALSTLYKGQEYTAYKDLSYMGNVETAFNEWARFFKGRLDAAKHLPPSSPK